MKKTLIPFLLAGVLSTTSCTESFEPTVDYGDQTHINDYSALLAAVNNLNKSMSERFDALNQLLDKNLADIKLSIDANTGAIKAIGDNVDTINTTLLNGFSALSTQIDETGKQIVYAINENGEMLRLEIDANGKLISSKIEGLEASIKALIEAVNSQTTTLGQKIDALNTMINKGFADVIAKIGAVGDQLHLDIKETNTALGTINTNMLKGFTILGEKIDTNGNAIIAAINANGNKLELAIGKNGEVISGEIEEFHKEYTTNSEAELKQLGNILGAIEGLKKANNTNATTIIAQLKELLAKNQIYTTENPQELYMSPDKFQQIEEGGEGSNIYNTYLKKIEAFTPAFESVQVVNEAGFEAEDEKERVLEDVIGTNVHGHAIFAPQTNKDQSILIAGDPKIENFSNELPVVRVIKTALSCHYKVTIKGGCGYSKIYKLKIQDVEGTKFVNSNGQIVADFEVGGASTVEAVNFELVVYDKVAKKPIDKIVAFAYCVQ